MQRKGKYFLGMLLLLLLLQSALLQAEPIEIDQVGNEPAALEPVWGDPGDQTESPWTWFGMGYEQRMQIHGSAQFDPAKQILEKKYQSQGPHGSK
jgi:hypothetical protein